MAPEESAAPASSPEPAPGCDPGTSAGEPLGDQPAARRPFGYPRERRVNRGPELNAVRLGGRRIRTEHLDVRLLADPTAPAGRVGIVVPRHKHSAVDRNRLRRRLRELVRTRLLPGLPPCQLVIRTRVEAYGDDFAALGRQVDRIVREVAKLVKLVNPGGVAGA